MYIHTYMYIDIDINIYMQFENVTSLLSHDTAMTSPGCTDGRLLFYVVGRGSQSMKLQDT